MFSHFLRTRERDGVVAIFHELHPEPIYCSNEQWQSLKSGTANNMKNLRNRLVHKKLIINNHAEDNEEMVTASRKLDDKLNQTTILYLMTAQACNMKCGYCPVPGQGKSLLTPSDAIAGIKLWGEHLKERYDPSLEYYVIFYGGEPLLNTPVIYSSLRYLDDMVRRKLLPDNIKYMIATNGTLVDRALVKVCYEYKVDIALGLDGTQNINDSLRVDEKGGGTYKKIVAAIKLLVNNGINTFISASITPYNISNLPELSSFFKSLGVEKFGFNFLKGRALLDLVGSDGVENYYRKASLGVIECALKHNKPGFEFQYEKKKSAFETKNFFPVDCTCYGNQLVIQPGGQVSNCPFYKADIGHIQNLDQGFRIWDQSIVKEWRKRHPLYHPFEAKAISGGGCAWSSIDLGNCPANFNHSEQIFSEEVLNELIWSEYRHYHNT